MAHEYLYAIKPKKSKPDIFDLDEFFFLKNCFGILIYKWYYTKC